MKKIENGDTVKVNYTGKFEDGSVFDTSMVEGRQPLTVTLGQGQLIPGFEKGLVDRWPALKRIIRGNRA
jgi:FKBP-type peptidyl-prolyl cis-trans isomerase